MSEEASLDEFTDESEVSDNTTDHPKQELIQGVAWSTLDHVPQDWEANNIASDLDLLAGNNFSSDDFVDEGGIPLIRIRDLETDETTVNFAGEYDSKYLIENGDLLVGMDGEFEPHLWSGPQSLLNQRVCKIEPRNQYNKIFLRYGLDKPLYYIQKSIAGTTVKHLSQSNIRDINLPTPSLEEQRKIATVLYTVDQAIQKTEEIIEQTKRAKQGAAQSLFHHGIEREDTAETWLGEIPETWTVVQFSEIIDSTRNGLYKSSDAYGDGYPIAKMGNALDNRILDMSTADRLELTEQEREKYALEEGDLIFARRAQEVSGAGHCSFVPRLDELTVFESSLIRVRLTDDVEPKFYAQYFEGPVGSRSIERIVTETSISGVATSDLVDLKIALPSLSEQKEIASTLSSFDKQTKALREEISQLQGLKRGLMQDLLSGAVRTHETDIEVPEAVLAQD